MRKQWIPGPFLSPPREKGLGTRLPWPRPFSRPKHNYKRASLAPSACDREPANGHVIKNYIIIFPKIDFRFQVRSARNWVGRIHCNKRLNWNGLTTEALSGGLIGAKVSKGPKPVSRKYGDPPSPPSPYIQGPSCKNGDPLASVHMWYACARGMVQLAE